MCINEITDKVTAVTFPGFFLLSLYIAALKAHQMSSVDDHWRSSDCWNVQLICRSHDYTRVQQLTGGQNETKRKSQMPATKEQQRKALCTHRQSAWRATRCLAAQQQAAGIRTTTEEEETSTQTDGQRSNVRAGTVEMHTDNEIPICSSLSWLQPLKSILGRIAWLLPSNRCEDRHCPGLKDELSGHSRDRTTALRLELSWFWTEGFEPEDLHEQELVLGEWWKFNDITSKCGASMSRSALGRAWSSILTVSTIRLMPNAMENYWEALTANTSGR